MKKIIITMLLGSMTYLAALTPPPMNASRIDIAKYVIHATWESKTYEELGKQIYPYLKKSYQKKILQTSRSISKKMTRTMKKFERRNGPRYRDWKGKKPDVEFKFYGGVGRNNGVTWEMYPKSSVGGSMTFQKTNGVWKIISL